MYTLKIVIIYFLFLHHEIHINYMVIFVTKPNTIIMKKNIHDRIRAARAVITELQKTENVQKSIDTGQRKFQKSDMLQGNEHETIPDTLAFKNTHIAKENKSRQRVKMANKSFRKGKN